MQIAASIQAVIDARVPALAIIGPLNNQTIDPIMEPTPSIQEANDETPTCISDPIVCTWVSSNGRFEIVVVRFCNERLT